MVYTPIYTAGHTNFYKMWLESMVPFMSPSILCIRGCSDPPIALNNPNYPGSMMLESTFDRKNNYFGNLNLTSAARDTYLNYARDCLALCSTRLL